MSTNSNATISMLSESGWSITPADDIRGRTVKDKDGPDLGKVHDLLIDDQEHWVRFLLVEHGGFLGLGATESFIPVDDITTITDTLVSINHTREHVAAAPAYNPDLIDARSYHGSIYDHYGYTPFWDAGYDYPSEHLGRTFRDHVTAAVGGADLSAVAGPPVEVPLRCLCP